MLLHAALLALPLLVSAQNYGGGSSPSSSSSASASSTASAEASSETGAHDVDVGKGGLLFTPDTLKAAVGDKVNFHFYPLNHSVVQSSFNDPCQPLQTTSTPGIFSGFMPVKTDEAPQMFTVTINDTNPIWLYCSQTFFTHCQAGMSMVINPPATGNTIAAYQAASKTAANSTSPANVQGGILAKNVDSDDDDSSSSNSTSSSASPSKSATSSGSKSASGSATSPSPTGGDAPRAMMVSWVGMGVAFVASAWAWSLM